MTPLAYNLDQAAAATGVSKETLLRAIRTGQLRAKRTARRQYDGEPVGRHLMTVAALQEWLDGLPNA